LSTLKNKILSHSQYSSSASILISGHYVMKLCVQRSMFWRSLMATVVDRSLCRKARTCFRCRYHRCVRPTNFWSVLLTLTKFSRNFAGRQSLQYYSRFCPASATGPHVLPWQRRRRNIIISRLRWESIQAGAMAIMITNCSGVIKSRKIATVL